MDARSLRVLGILVTVLAATPAVAVAMETLALLAGHPFVTAALESIVGPVCHHLRDRTLAIGGRPLPVCARCTGLYLGYLAGLVGGLALAPVIVRIPRRLATAVAGAVAALVVAVALAVLERAGAFSTGNLTRALFGLPLGAGPAVLLALSSAVLLDGRRFRAP